MEIMYVLDNLASKLVAKLYCSPPQIGAGRNGHPLLLPSGEDAFNRIIIFKEFELLDKHDIIQQR